LSPVGSALDAATCSLICPTFLLPYRRYASTSLIPLARDYLEQDHLSYQQAVAPGGQVIGYVTPPNASTTGTASSDEDKIDERALHRSTLWRFLLFLGTQTTALQVGLRLWSEHDPSSTMHRFVGAVAPHKYCSQKRGEILRSARRLLSLIDHWRRTFSESFFPRFATRAREP